MNMLNEKPFTAQEKYHRNRIDKSALFFYNAYFLASCGQKQIFFTILMPRVRSAKIIFCKYMSYAAA